MDETGNLYYKVNISFVSPHERIIKFLDSKQAKYRVINHSPAGSALEYEQIVGTKLEQQLKALFVEYRIGVEVKYAICVVPGNSKLDLNKVRAYFQANVAQLASKEKLLELTGLTFGIVPPLGEIYNLETVVDWEALQEEELCFNAGSLEKSVFIPRAEYQKLVVEKIGNVRK